MTRLRALDRIGRHPALWLALVGLLASCQVVLAASPRRAPGWLHAAAITDTAEAELTVIKDTPEEYRSAGTWSFIDRDDPPDGYLIPDIIDDITITGTNWNFAVTAYVQDWCIGNCGGHLNGADNTKISMNGHHVHGPHTGPAPPVDTDNNYLSYIEAIQTAIDWGIAPVSMTKQARSDHPAGGPTHFDLYGFEFYASAMQGPPNMLTGDVEIAAKHTSSDNSKDKLTFGGNLASTSAAGAKASFDPEAGTLRLHFGTIDVVNDTGLMFGGIDPSFGTDPILNGTFGDVVLTYLGPTGDGGFRFGGSQLALVDPEGDLTLQGGFSEYDIYDTSRNGIIDSYALFDSVATSDAGSCQSGFLKEFDDLDIMGRSLSSSDWLDVQGVGLSFTTSTNLVLLTGGFTLPAVDVPATIGVCALKRVPGTQEPGSPH